MTSQKSAETRDFGWLQYTALELCYLGRMWPWVIPLSSS